MTNEINIPANFLWPDCKDCCKSTDLCKRCIKVLNEIATAIEDDSEGILLKRYKATILRMFWAVLPNMDGMGNVIRDWAERHRNAEKFSYITRVWARQEQKKIEVNDD